MERFFGGRPIVVLLRLAVISVIVGVVMAALNLDAFALVESLKRLAKQVYDMGFDAIEWGLQYFLLGAVVVFPVWLVARIFKAGGSSRD